MKITIQDEDQTVSVDNHFEFTTVWEARDLFASALLGMKYCPDVVAYAFPSEEDLDDAISEGVREALGYAADSI